MTAIRYRILARALFTLLFLALASLPAFAGGLVTAITGTQTAAGTFGTGTTVTYTVTLGCTGLNQGDNPGSEFSEQLPAEVTLVSATASSGTAVATIGTNTVNWDGAITAGIPVTITITATINATVGQLVGTQGLISFDADHNGTNESTTQTDGQPGAGLQQTTFVVLAAEVSGTQTMTGTFVPGGSVTLAVTLTNDGSGAQADNVGDEFVETLPAQFDFVGATPSAGAITTTTNSDDDSTIVHWNGGIPKFGSVTITINCTVRTSAGGQIATAQGIINYDANLDGTNETMVLTDDPDTNADQDANTATISSALVSASQTVTGIFVAGGKVTYTVILTNSGNGAQTDNPGDEFAETLPASLQLISANANAGTTVANGGLNQITWNGGIPAGGSVTITIKAQILAAAQPKDVISAQGDVAYDFDLNGTNEMTTQTFQPPLGEDPTPTKFTVANFDDAIFLIGTKPANFSVLANDAGTGITPTLHVAGLGAAQFGTSSTNANESVTYTPTGKIPLGSRDGFTYQVDAGDDGGYTATVSVRTMEAVAATYNGLVLPDGAGQTAQNSGLLKVTVTKTGMMTGALTLNGKKYPLVAKFDLLGVARFGPKATADFLIKRPVPRGQSPLPELRVAVHIPPVDALDTIVATITEGGQPLATGVADRAYYTAKKNPVPPLLPLPAGFAGKYTVAFPAVHAPNLGYGATEYPQGAGFGFVTVAPSGVVTVKGTLADGTPISYSNALSLSKHCPIYVALYKGKGCVTGAWLFDSSGNTDVASDGPMLWFKAGDPKATRYPGGWGVRLNCVGSLFALPPKGTIASVFTGVGATAPAGNVDFGATGGNLSAPILLSANVDAKNKVQFVSPPAGLLPKLTITLTGLVTGSLVNPDTHKVVTFKGIIVQKLQEIDGFFLGAQESGLLHVEPK